MHSYDTIVIGGGGAGLSAAFTSAGLGKKTLLVEKNKLGGECTWNGCIPSKALIHLAEEAHTARLFSKAEGTFSVPSPFPAVDEVRWAVYSHETPEVLSKRGIETLIGRAVFTGRNSIDVDGTEYRAKRFVLAVGSRPMVPPIPGLADVPYLTNENLFSLEKLPESLLVMGGGPIGIELSQAMARLGVRVTVVEMMDRILFREDSDVADVIREKLEEEGVLILTGAKATGVSLEKTKNGNQVELMVEQDGKKNTLKADQLLVAVGRSSAAKELNLETAGVEVTGKGVQTNSRLQTANSNIYAAGDVVGPYAFSHMAEYQGVKAALNALTPLRSRVNYTHTAWTTFTDPEIARAGMLEEEARKLYGNRIRIYTRRFETLDRGMTSPGTKGIVKIILDSRSRILGAHIAGPRAGELICEIQVLKTLGIRYHKLKDVIHPYPTFADILRQIAKQVALDNILNHPVVKFVRSFQGKKNGA